MVRDILCKLGIHFSQHVCHSNITENGPSLPITKASVLTWLGPVVTERICSNCNKITYREEDWES